MSSFHSFPRSFSRLQVSHLYPSCNLHHLFHPSFLMNFTNLKTSFGLVHSTFISSSASCFMAFAIIFFVPFLAFLYLFSAHLFVHHNLNAFFFRSIASFTCSFHHHVFPPSPLAFVFAHNSSQAFKTRESNRART